MDSYSEFIQNVDTVLMGWNTYYQVSEELSPDQWVYENLLSYVITHRKIPSTENIVFTDESPDDLVRRLREEKGRSIWICGGADLIRQLVQEDLIDVYYISVIPVLLGEGIRLFENAGKRIRLHIEHVHSRNGIAELIYHRGE